MIVVDTNIIAGAYLESIHSPLIEGVIRKDREWIAPYLWRSEFRNVLMLYMKKSILSLDQAQQIVISAERRMLNRERWPISSRILELVQSSGCSAYDCEFISLARDLDLPLVTLDKKVLKQFPAVAVSPKDFTGR